MNKQDVKRSLGKQGCDFLTMNQIADALQVDRGTVRSWVHGIPFIRAGNKKLFFIDDIAEMLIDRKERA